MSMTMTADEYEESLRAPYLTCERCKSFIVGLPSGIKVCDCRVYLIGDPKAEEEDDGH